jgi:hypothetical protein
VQPNDQVHRARATAPDEANVIRRARSGATASTDLLKYPTSSRPFQLRISTNELAGFFGDAVLLRDSLLAKDADAIELPPRASAPLPL